MNCPKCNSEHYVRDGIVKQKQRYLCKHCKYRYTVAETGKPKDLKRLAIQLYLEGLGFRSIARVLQVSNVSVLNWVKALGSKVEEYRKTEGDIEIIEMDELHTYIGEKKTTVGSGLLLIEMDINSSTSYLAVGEQKRVKSYTPK
jgi:transposase-like protein